MMNDIGLIFLHIKPLYCLTYVYNILKSIPLLTDTYDGNSVVLKSAAINTDVDISSDMLT